MKKRMSSDGRRFFFFPPSIWALVGADLCSVLFSCVLGFTLRLLFPGVFSVDTYTGMLPVVLIFPALYATLRLYPGSLLPPAEEIKRLSLATSIGFLLLAAFFFLTKSSDIFSRTLFLTVWLLTLFLVPAGRSFVRGWFCRKPWWKTPAILMGTPAALQQLRAELRDTARIGFSPVALLYPQGSPSIGEERPPGRMKFFEHRLSLDCDDEILFAELSQQYPHAVVLMHLPSFVADQQERLLENVAAYFRGVLALPEVRWAYCIPAQVADIRGSFALVMRRNLADIRRLRVKRLLDVVCTLLAAPVGLPLILLLACLIRMDSPGPAFFRQRRVGRNGGILMVYKFRTMVCDAEALLARHLAENPSLAAEWKASQKLHDDPRITRLGRFLRRTSLDELPQLFNVLRGEMSLVGPRPIVPEEVNKYGDSYSPYARVCPGITGLWQISGRSDLAYEDRVALDRYYIANWSVWLDIYILAKTIPAILSRRGAY